MSILGLDIGTSSVKAIIFNKDFNIISKSYRKYNVVSITKGYYEFDYYKFKKAIFDVIKESAYSVKKSDPVKAIGASVIGSCSLPINKELEPLYNPIIANDNRGLSQLRILSKKISSKDIYKISGQPLSTISYLSKILWFKYNKPKIFKNIWKYICLEELLFLFLGLEPIVSHSLASTSMAFDIKNKKWSEEILNAADISPDIFPISKPSGYVVGKIPKKIIDSLSLGNDCLAVTGGYDCLCCSLGSGIINSGKTFNIIGSSEAIIITLDYPIFSEGLFQGKVPIVPYVINKLYSLIAHHFGSGNLLKWMKNTIFKDLDTIAKEKKKKVYQIIDSEASNIPSDLFIIPHILGSGVPYSDSEAKGIFLGFSFNTSRAEILRAFLEAPIYEDLSIKKFLEKQKIFLNEIIASGGGSKSDKWLQMRADILANKIIRMNVIESGCFGAAILAGASTGIWPSLKEIIAKKVIVKKRFKPNLKFNERYEKLFKIYKDIYLQNKKMNKKLALLK